MNEIKCIIAYNGTEMGAVAYLPAIPRIGDYLHATRDDETQVRGRVEQVDWLIELTNTLPSVLVQIIIQSSSSKPTVKKRKAKQAKAASNPSSGE